MMAAPRDKSLSPSFLSSLLKNSICYERLQSPLALFSILDDLNVIGAAPTTCRGRVASALWPDARIDDEVVSRRIRRGGETQQTATSRRNPKGWIDKRRIALSFVLVVSLR